ncbi:MAG: inositol monophosphatase family protein [Solirubrobacterales bacterium]
MARAQDAGTGADRWLAACRRIVATQAELYRGRRGIAARTEYAGVGEGGDRSLVIDREAEEIAFAELERLHREGLEFTAISEERGSVRFGDGASSQRVVIDPIDGSLNARRTLPSFGFSLAVASGPSMADVELGFVHDFGSGEEFVAVRGQGATLDGGELQARGPGYGLELVGIEMTKPELILPLISGLAGRAYRIRAIGSLALTLCYVGAGRLDGMLGARPARSVDVAAAQLIAREAGASVKFERLELGDAPLDLDARYLVVAGLDEELLGTLLTVQRDAAAAGEPA